MDTGRPYFHGLVDFDIFVTAFPLGYRPTVVHTTLELVACVMTVVGFGLDVAGLLRHFDPGPVGMTLCILIRSSSLIVATTSGGITSVVMHTVDRYWRIVHPINHRKHYRRWMLYVGLVVPWVNGFGTTFLHQIATARIISGKCSPTSSWTVTSRKVCVLRSERISFCIIKVARR